MRQLLALVLAAGMVLPPATPLFADNIAPPTDADLHHMREAARAALAKTRACRDSGKPGGKCVSFPCTKSNELTSNLDEARRNLLAMQERLQEARKTALKHFQDIEHEHILQSKDKADAQYRLAYSKFLADTGKMILDVVSLADGVQSIYDAFTKAPTGEQLSRLEAAINETKIYDQAGELATGSISFTDDMRGFMGQNPRMSQGMSDLVTLKGGASDLAGAVLDVRQKLKEAQVSGDSKSFAAVAGSIKGIGQLAGKLGLKAAEIEQNKLLQEIAQDAVNEGALDKAAYAAFADYQRLLDREAALDGALDAMRDAWAASYACSNQCGNAPAPGLVANTSGQSYGEMLKDYNGRLGGSTQKINASSANFSTKPCDEKEKEKQNAKKDTKTDPNQKQLPDCQRGTITNSIEAIAGQDAGTCK